MSQQGYEQVPDKIEGQLQEKKENEIRSVDSSATSMLTIAVAVFLAIFLYEVTTRISALGKKQAQTKELLTVYRQAVSGLEHKIKILNLTTGVPITQQDQQQYLSLIQTMKKVQNFVTGISQTGDSAEQLTPEMMGAIQQIETEIEERAALINMLLAHSKEQIRKKKIEMMEKVAAKDDFKQQKVRNPWAMGRLNLRTPFIDTLQRRHMQEQVQKQMERLQQTYHFSLFSKQLPLCVVVTGRNNARNYRYEYNLQSIINQDYKNYKLVVIDDASDDGTGDLIRIFLKNSKLPPERYFFIQNKERLSAVPNINNAIKNYCDKDDIAVLVSGDDELLGKLVFKVLNVVYQTKKPGVAYTNHFYGKLHENDFDKGYSRTYSLGEIKNKLYRFIGQKFGHMRTFLVSLFLEIKEEHMRHRDGRWVDATYDETFILPMLEMACDSIEYIDEYVYLYNYGTGQNDGEINHDIQSAAALYVRQLPRYSCIEKFQKYVI